MVSLDHVQVWKDFCPSPVIIEATAGTLLPNKTDILLGVGSGSLAIFSNNKIYEVY